MSVPLWWESCTYPVRVVPDRSGRQLRQYTHPLVQRGHGLEDTFPWRKGYCLILRLPLSRRAVALGVWTGRQEVTDDGDGPMLALQQMEKWW